MKAQLKVNQVLLFAVLLTVVLFYGRVILIPLTSAVLLAMLMAPLCSRLDRRGWHRSLSCLVCVFILLVIFLGMLAVLIAQLSALVQDLPLFQQKAEALLVSVQQAIETRFDIPAERQTEFIKKETQQLNASLGNYASQTLQSTIRLLIGLVITLFFTFLMLFHKEKYQQFFLRFSPGNTVAEKETFLASIGLVTQQYLKGRAISIAMFFVLYLVTLLVVGIEGAWILAAVAALVNLIPYLGPVLAAILPTISALATEANWQPALWVFIFFCLIQALDNYFVTPYYLGAEVNLSALTTFVAIICGGLVWGIAGMILFIPLFSIAKTVFDHVPSLQHYGMLIGDQGKKPSFFGWLKKRTRSKPEA